MFLVSISSFIFSIYFTCCLPWFLLQVIEQCISFTGSRSLPILEKCLNHVNLRCAVLSTNVLSWCRMLHTVSSSSCYVSIPATVYSTRSFLLWGFFFCLLFLDTSIPNRTAALKLRRFRITSLWSYLEWYLPSVVCWIYSPWSMLCHPQHIEVDVEFGRKAPLYTDCASRIKQDQATSVSGVVG